MDRPGVVRYAVLALGLGAATLVVIADFTAIYSTKILTVPCSDSATGDLARNCAPTGGDRHSHALLVLGALILVMTWGAAIGRSRPASLALLAGGVIVLVITLVFDLPDIHASGLLKATYSETTTDPDTGFWLELLGGLFASAAGALSLARPAAAKG